RPSAAGTRGNRLDREDGGACRSFAPSGASCADDGSADDRPALRSRRPSGATKFAGRTGIAVSGPIHPGLLKTAFAKTATRCNMTYRADALRLRKILGLML